MADDESIFKNVFPDHIVADCFYSLMKIARKFFRATAISCTSGKHKSK